MNDFDLNKESFDKKPEYIISKIINEHSNKICTDINMLNPYDYNLNCFNKKTKKFLGYIECEKSNHKQLDGIKWEHSFLARKIFKYDKSNGYIKQELKDNADKTIYLKFNYNYGLNDCICCCIEHITFFNPDYQFKTNERRTDITLRTDKNDKRVAKGIENCIRYIENFFLKSGE